MPKDQEIPKYVVQEKSLIGNEMYEAGAIAAYDGLPAANLKPTCALGEQRAKEYEESNAARVRQMNAQYSESTVGDPAAFAAAMAKANTEMMASLPAMIGAAVAEGIATAMATARAEHQPEAPADAKAGKGKDKAGESLV